MLYCPKCQVLTDDKTCPSCGGKTRMPPELKKATSPITADDAQLHKQEEQTAGDKPEDEEMSPRKRFLWRAVSVVLFILVVWGVVVVTDYAANALKALLTHG